MDLFKELLPGILVKKNYILTSDNEKEYVPFVVNRAASQHVDAILYSNALNALPHLDKKLQYDYLYYSITAKKRPYQKWFKNTESEDINAVKVYYTYSTEKAKNCLKILTNDQLLYIKDVTNISCT